MPRSRANIDHLVIAPSGIWLVDSKRYLSGRLERRDRGGWRTTDVRLYVGGRDNSSLVDGLKKQIDQVELTLLATPFSGVPVHGALCFVDAKLDMFARPFELRGVTVTWPRHLVAPMLNPDVVDGPTRRHLTHQLAIAFRAT